MKPAAEHYSRLIASILRESRLDFSATSERPGQIQVERGIVFARRMAGRVGEDRVPLTIDREDRVVDCNGHERWVYRCLLMYVMKLSGVFDAAGSTATPLLVECVQKWVGRYEGATSLPAGEAGETCNAAWSALALFTLGVEDESLARSVFSSIAAAQHRSGAFFHTSASDNPETHWYHELLLLHALGSYAAATGDADLLRSAWRNARFHQEETQPDHASNQPWGLFALASQPETAMLADQVLHSAKTLGASALTSILLADALYCLLKLKSEG